MASNAYGAFQYNLVDVDRLIESHGILSGTGQGRRGLGHVTRSAVIMLCASWELYLEHAVLEGLRFALQSTSSPDELPIPGNHTGKSHGKSHGREITRTPIE
jgi:hypothetical protein